MENRVILKVRAGSSLHGTSLPTSDEDFIGVYLSTPDELLGLSSSEIIEEDVVSKKENGRNDKDAVDCKYYELRKFCNLALNANPTILELLFADEKNIVHIDEYGRKLIANRDLFISKKVRHSFIGYAFSQKRKSQVKSENLKTLFLAREDFLKVENKSMMLYSFMESQKQLPKYILKTNYPSHITIADTNFQNQKIRDVIKKLDYRIDNGTHRKDGMLEHGCCYKFIGHTLRLLLQGEELMLTGNINFPLKDRELLLKIKRGEMKPIEIMELIEAKEEEFTTLESKSNLPYKADFNKVNDFIISMYKEHVLLSLCDKFYQQPCFYSFKGARI